MRLLQRLCFMVLVSGLMAAQSATPARSDSSTMENDVKKLLDAVAAQQKMLAEQQQEIERLKQQLSSQTQAVSASSDQQSPHVVNATLTEAASTNLTTRPASDTAQETERKESPLSFRIGGAEFTPGGFMDFTTIFRSTNTGNAGGTNFFSIPFSNATTGHLTETRFTPSNSRVNIKATSKFGGNDVTGFFEMDFLGNDANNVFVTSNSHVMRMRHYFVDVKRGNWEILAGQTWGMLTPNRVGLSPYSADVFYSQNMDFNYQVGLTWTRAPQFRLVYHPNPHWAMGVALENAQQYGGPGSGGFTEVIFPAAFNTGLQPQFDPNSGSGGTGFTNGTVTPNLHPDVIPKIAYDTDLGGKHFHWEAAGLLTSVKIANLANGAFTSHTKTGGGVSSAVNLEIFKGFRLVANGFYSDGGGRYIFGMGPQAIAIPINAAGATCAGAAGAGSANGCDLEVSMVHAGSGIFGFEWQAQPKSLIYAYYGGAYFQRDFAPDLTIAPNAAGFRPNIGFGFPAVFNGATQVFGGSANNANKSIQEPTLGWVQTFWRNPQYGALQLITQVSYLTRAPWFVAAGAPKNAHLAMGWVDLRYVLP